MEWKINKWKNLSQFLSLIENKLKVTARVNSDFPGQSVSGIYLCSVKWKLWKKSKVWDGIDCLLGWERIIFSFEIICIGEDGWCCQHHGQLNRWQEMGIKCRYCRGEILLLVECWHYWTVKYFLFNHNFSNQCQSFYNKEVSRFSLIPLFHRNSLMKELLLFLHFSQRLSWLGTTESRDTSEDEDDRNQEPFDQEENEGKQHWCLVTIILRLVVSVAPARVVAEHYYWALKTMKIFEGKCLKH